jgi:hypothetical protein
MLRNTCIAAFALLLVAPHAHAQSQEDKSAARAIATEGAEAFDKGDFKTAADRFRRAVAIFDDAKAPTVPPTLLVGLARSEAKMGHYIAAVEAYNRIIHQGMAPGASQVFTEAVADARREIEPLTPKIASVTIRVTGCEKPKVTVDDQPISSAAIGVKKPVDPGTHVVKATADGCEPGQTSFRVDEAQSTEATIGLVPSPNRPSPAGTETPSIDHGAPEQTSPSSLRAASYVALGVGGAGLLVGGITGLLAIGKHGDLADTCVDDVCRTPQAKSDLDAYHTMTTLSTVGFIVGAAGIATGAVLFFMSPRAQAKSAWIVPTIAPGGIGAVGRF